MRHLPLSFNLAVFAVKMTILAAQVHLFVLLRRRLPRHWLWAAYAVAGIALLLVAGSPMFGDELDFIGLGPLPRFWRLMGGIWVVGSFAGYCMIGTWLGWRKLRPPKPVRSEGPAGDDDTTILPARRELLTQAARVTLAAPFAVAGYGTFIGRTNFEVREVDIALPDLPRSLEGLRLAQLTDIHFGLDLTGPELERVVAMTNETRPHVALVTGDLITESGDPLEKCLDIVSGLRADSGVWACMGNHERYAESENFCQFYARDRGIVFLRNASESLRFGDAHLNICGVDYQRTSRPYLHKAEDLMDERAVNVLLSHNPDVFPVASKLGYDLVVGGHTHGGQVTVEIVEQWANPGRFFTPFVAGKYRLDRSVLYVSRGIGTINLPMRLGAMPEISVLTLRRA